MRLLRFLGRFFVYSLVLLWAPAWLAAWWLWPPTPRSGWQIPANERCLGFLSDSRHVVTEEVTGEGKDRKATGIVRVRAIETGAIRVSYTSDKNAYRVLDEDLLSERLVLDKVVEYPPGRAGDVGLCDIRVRDAWTGTVRFDERRVHHTVTPVCSEHRIMAYVRHVDPPGSPEVIWRDVKSGTIRRRFPEMAGPLDFSSTGKRFLAASWGRDANFNNTLQLISVPDGEAVHSARIFGQPTWRILAKIAANDRDVYVQQGVIDCRSGRTLLDCSTMRGLVMPSDDGRYVIVNGGHEQPAVTWRAVASGQDEIKHAFGAVEVGGGGNWIGPFDQRDFHWINVGTISRPQWPWGHRLPWLNRWLPEQPKRTCFIVAEQNTGRIIVQGVGHQPNFVSRTAACWSWKKLAVAAGCSGTFPSMQGCRGRSRPQRAWPCRDWFCGDADRLFAHAPRSRHERTTAVGAVATRWINPSPSRSKGSH
jgi:hypothetical protein